MYYAKSEAQKRKNKKVILIFCIKHKTGTTQVVEKEIRGKMADLEGGGGSLGVQVAFLTSHFPIVSFQYICVLKKSSRFFLRMFYSPSLSF